MKVKEKIFEVVDGNGKSVDLEKEKNIVPVINGNQVGDLKDLFIRHTLDGNEILGFSLLNYFKIQDGSLVDTEGNTVSLILADKNIPLKFKNISVKFVPLDPIEVAIPYIEAFSYALIGIQKPEVIFSDLSNPERKAIVDARELKQTEKAIADKALADKALADKAKADAEAKQLAAKAQADAEAKQLAAKAQADAEKAEADLKASINPSFVYEKKDYNHISELFADEGGREYNTGPYHFFYVRPTEKLTNPKDATVLIKRGESWFQEDEDGEIKIENDKTVVYEFSDGEQKKKLVLDVENGTITVDNAEKSE